MLQIKEPFLSSEYIVREAMVELWISLLQSDKHSETYRGTQHLDLCEFHGHDFGDRNNFCLSLLTYPTDGGHNNGLIFHVTLNLL